MTEIQNHSDLKQANMQWSSFIFHEEIWCNLELNSPTLMWQLDFVKYLDTQAFPLVHEWILIQYIFFLPLMSTFQVTGRKNTRERETRGSQLLSFKKRSQKVPCDSCPTIFHWPKSGHLSIRKLDHVILVWWLTCIAKYTKSRYYELLPNNSSRYIKSPQ